MLVKTVVQKKLYSAIRSLKKNIERIRKDVASAIKHRTTQSKKGLSDEETTIKNMKSDIENVITYAETTPIARTT